MAVAPAPGAPCGRLQQGGCAGARVAAVSGHHAGLHPGRLHLLGAHDQGVGRRGGSSRFISWDPWPPTPSAPAPHRTLFSQDLFSFLFCLMLL